MIRQAKTDKRNLPADQPHTFKIYKPSDEKTNLMHSISNMTVKSAKLLPAHLYSPSSKQISTRQLLGESFESNKKIPLKTSLRSSSQYNSEDEENDESDDDSAKMNNDKQPNKTNKQAAAKFERRQRLRGHANKVLADIKKSRSRIQNYSQKEQVSLSSAFDGDAPYLRRAKFQKRKRKQKGYNSDDDSYSEESSKSDYSQPAGILHIMDMPTEIFPCPPYLLTVQKPNEKKPEFSINDGEVEVDFDVQIIKESEFQQMLTESNQFIEKWNKMNLQEKEQPHSKQSQELLCNNIEPTIEIRKKNQVNEISHPEQSPILIEKADSKANINSVFQKQELEKYQPEIFKCPNCDKQYPSQQLVKRHFKIRHRPKQMK